MIDCFDLNELTAAARGGDRAVLERLDAVCQEVGAFALTGVELPGGLMAQMHRDTLDLFRLPPPAKQQLQDPAQPFAGWKGDTNRNEFGFPDKKETFHIGPRADSTLRGPELDGSLAPAATDGDCGLWPADLPSMQASWHAYYRAMQDVGTRLGLAMAAALGVPQDVWLELIEHNWADLAANYYPPVGEGTPGVRNAVHSDLTMFTVLYQDEGGGGGLHMQTRGGEWLAIPPDQQTYLVNIGELLTFLTRGRWWAVPHEVSEADPAAPGADTPRISIPFFYRPNDSNTITPLLGVADDATGETVEPIQVGEWVSQRKQMATATPN